MSMLYVTADRIGGWEGGASVTFHESDFLKSLAKERIQSCRVLGREQLENIQVEEQDPWCWDERAYRSILSEATSSGKLSLAHFYAGTFTKTIEVLKSVGTKISVTAAAHDIQLSKKSHEELGLPFDLPHLTNPELWKKYLEGYKNADALIVPSEHSKKVMEGFGCTNPIHVIHHGVDIPEKVAPFPDHFAVGNLGSWGADKNLKCLLQAWKKLAYKDSVLYLGGRDSTSAWATHLINAYGGGNIVRLGWLKNVSDFYNRICCYIQSSYTEGWSLEVSEAAAYARPVLCSKTTGASDIIDDFWKFDADSPDQLAELIDYMKDYSETKGCLEDVGNRNRERAKETTWEKSGEKYKDVWRPLL